MFEGYRIVCVTPAGRRRYMKLLVPQILASGLVDRYDLWVNTDDAGDRAFMKALTRLDERVRVVPQPRGEKPSWSAIRAFFPGALDEDTIYIRLDDDVVWLEPGFFEILLRFRIANPRYFLVMPLIVNNAVCTNLLQTCGKVAPSRYVGATCMDRVGWHEPGFAVRLHRFFLDLVARDETHRLHCGPREIALNRFSINAICWFGRDMAAIGGEVRPGEEEDLSNVIPTRLGRPNCFCTDTIAAHFAFYVQRRALDKTDLLQEYAQVLSQRAELKPLLLKTTAIADEIDAREPPPVEQPFAAKPSWRAAWRKLVPRKRKKQQVPTLLEPGPLL